MKEPKRYDFRKDDYTLQVLHTDSKYNKDKILKYLICEYYLLNNADSFRIFFYEYNIFIVHLVFPLSYPNFVKIRFILQLTLFLLSSYAQITNVLFFFKTIRNDHFLSGKHLK
jgi:hypothetical protein